MTIISDRLNEITMKWKNSYTYEMDGTKEGPYLFEQIVGMAKQGLIRADTKIDCVETGERLSLIEFFHSMGDESRDVSVKDVEMKFGSMVGFMIMWVIASIPAGILLLGLVIAGQALLVMLWGAIASAR